MITAMIHVPDVRETAEWYRSVGFTILAWHPADSAELETGDISDDGPWDWARIGFGRGSVMLSSGGKPSTESRREVDLYINVDPPPAGEGVDALYSILKDKVDIVAAPYDAFHGNRELIIRELNGFWITFAQPVAR
jgi:hypothetical protein